MRHLVCCGTTWSPLHYRSILGLLVVQLFEKAEKLSRAQACVWLSVSSAMTSASVPRCAHGWWGACCAEGKAVPLRAGCRETSVTGCSSPWGEEEGALGRSGCLLRCLQVGTIPCRVISREPKARAWTATGAGALWYHPACSGHSGSLSSLLPRGLTSWSATS